jgi:hypothetical protein
MTQNRHPTLLRKCYLNTPESERGGVGGRGREMRRGGRKREIERGTDQCVTRFDVDYTLAITVAGFE